jgi:hypothetical protein
MKYIATILSFYLSFLGYSQEKVDSDLFIFSNWAIQSFSVGTPFISSDTVVLFYCGNAYGRDDKECWEQGTFEWEIYFDEPLEGDEIQQDFFVVYRSGTLSKKISADEKYMFNDVLYWEFKGKFLIISNNETSTKYKVSKMKNQLLILIKHP